MKGEMIQMAIIYKITNTITGETYIGKTIRTVDVRLAEHKRDCQKYSGKNIPLYNAVQKYGWDSFTVGIVEENISNSLINEKEKYYISLYDTYHNGYNATEGGDGGRTSSKLQLNEVLEIINILKDPDSLESIPIIAEKYNVHASVISNINLGKTWRQEGEIYPLRNYSVSGLTLTKQCYNDIVNDILYTDKPLSQIAQEYNVSESRMTAINQGYECYNNENNFYKNIYTGTYPIRMTSNKKHNLESQFQWILYDILFTNLSMAKIGKKYNISGSSLQYIQAGQRQKILTQDFVVPLRKNIIINQKIYQQKYGEVMQCATLD